MSEGSRNPVILSQKKEDRIHKILRIYRITPANGRAGSAFLIPHGLPPKSGNFFWQMF